jgi:uncharacterized FlaG/YvyC family protein
MRNVNNDLPVTQQIRTTPVKNDQTTKTSNNTVNSASSASAVAGATNTQAAKIPSVYEQNSNRMVLEQEMDKLIKVIMPDLGVQFRVHDSGQIITTVRNNDTQEVVREFPAEKILDIVHEMVQRLGIVANIKV